MTVQRVVLDTNVVVAALLFTSGRIAWIRHAWQRGKLTPIVCGATVAELVRVLTYPKFRLGAQERDGLLADFLPFVEVIALPEPWPALPACRDPHDQVFLALAVVAAADALVTGDQDLLALTTIGSVPIIAPDDLASAR